MDLNIAKVLLQNLLQQVEISSDGTRQLSRKISDLEIQALQIVFQSFNAPENGVIVDPDEDRDKDRDEDRDEDRDKDRDKDRDEDRDEDTDADTYEDTDEDLVEIDLSVFDLSTPSTNTRICLDFGTAMSKAALVTDDEDFEGITILELGIPGDQEEISKLMLVSSVFIDDEGLLWFGQSAIEVAKDQPEGSNRQQLDNIKRYLSEEGLNVKVEGMFNPTDIDITFGDLILSYLMYMTWCVNYALELLDGDYPRNIERRFAMPCLSGPAALEAEQRLRRYLGEAQVLADTFRDRLSLGVPLKTFMDAVHQIRTKKLDYQFVTKKISEPLGVAGSLLGPDTKTDMLAMVVDVGAGTTDFSLYRIAVNPVEGINTAYEVRNTACCLTEAGNYLDKLLKATIIKETGIDSNHQSWKNINWNLERNIRNYKETLFNESEVLVYIRECDIDIEINLSDFLALSQVSTFSDNLKAKIIDIMESINPDYTKWILENPTRNLVIVLTGGGATLPMVRDLAEGSITVHGYQIPLALAISFPTWLEEEHADLEDEYSRIAVALGGAREKILNEA